MAEEKQSNTYTIVVAVSAVIMIAFVMMLKGRETEHLKMSAQTTPEAEAQVLGKARDFNNVME
ncbi:hypothetical protein Q9L42_018000 [Methylomarinum sp. Ch1-1]|uniref:Uncharacterized protein n=1 Tax=Methylomarinum roseum TaxID=3067653 RepID=A0AAU7NT94_9GAMM|nr:hypothetical protein [Methylomarinum sp. Ch1-1]MDP4519754.1 hypothetical protein [Methylomarinum sp. Ch1-1]